MINNFRRDVQNLVIIWCHRLNDSDECEKQTGNETQIEKKSNIHIKEPLCSHKCKSNIDYREIVSQESSCSIRWTEMSFFMYQESRFAIVT